jgi:hypothetical protein
MLPMQRVKSLTYKKSTGLSAVLPFTTAILEWNRHSLLEAVEMGPGDC